MSDWCSRSAVLQLHLLLSGLDTNFQLKNKKLPYFVIKFLTSKLNVFVKVNWK